MKKFYLPAIVALIFSGCNNLEDAELTERSSFVRFYEGANRFIAAEAKPVPSGGYIIAGTIRVEGDNPDAKLSSSEPTNSVRK